MSELGAALSRAAQRNQELLSTLARTDYATRALEQRNAYIHDLEAQVSATDKELQKRHEVTENERKNHNKFHDIKHFASKLRGHRGVERLT